MKTTVKCPACDKEIIMQAICPECGFNIEIFEKAKRISFYLYNKGLEEFNDGMTLDAIGTLEKSLDFYKSNIVARNLLGILYFQIGEVGEALKHWVISSNMKKEENPATEYLEDMKKESSMLDRKNEAIKIYNEALTYAREGNDDIAIIRLLKAISLNPDLLNAYLLLALCYYKDEETKEKGKAYLEKAFSFDSKSSLMRYYAIKMASKDEKEDAQLQAELRKAKREMKVSFKNESLYFNFGKYRISKIVVTAVISIILSLVFVYFLDGFDKIHQSNVRLTNENKIYTEENDALKLEVENLNAELEVYKTEEKKELYKVTLNESIDLYNRKSYKEALEKIITIERSLLNADLIKRYDEIYPLILREAGRLYYSDGKTYFNQGKNDVAMEMLESSLKCAPNESYTAEVLYYMARIYEKTEKYDEARRLYQEIMQKFAGTHTAEQAEYRNKILG